VTRGAILLGNEIDKLTSLGLPLWQREWGILKMTSWKACGWTDRSDLEALGIRSFRGSEYDASICLKLRARTTMRSPKQIGGLKRYWSSAEDYYREKIRHARVNLASFQF